MGKDREMFTVRLVPAAEESHWRIADRRVLRCWLPLVGPTALALLCVFHDSFDQRAAVPDGDGSILHLSYEYVGAQVGTSIVRVRATLERLARFDLVTRDDVDDYGASELDPSPVWCLPALVRPLSPAEHRGLHSQIRSANPLPISVLTGGQS